jgi:hypothetical protein
MEQMHTTPPATLVKQQQAMISTVVDDINQPDTTIPSCAKE